MATSATARRPGLEAGVWGILPTPFVGPQLDVDEASVARIVDNYAAVGLNGLVALGVLGEAAQLSLAERRTVASTVRDVGTGLPIVIGLANRSTRPAVEEALVAREAVGDDLVAVMAQVNTPNPDRLLEHLAAIHDATGVGIVLQDYPNISGVVIGIDALTTTVQQCDAIVAVKAEAAPTTPTIAHLAAHTDVPVFGGLGGVGLLDELAAGAAGAMTGFSRPEALVDTVGAFHRDGFDAAHAAFTPWLPLANFEAQAQIGLSIRKELVRRRGWMDDASVRPPVAPFPAALAPIADQHLARLP
ncbi:MAG: dihydrodipicolinate synthase family protein [Nitriliruptoraceae bacterium]